MEDHLWRRSRIRRSGADQSLAPDLAVEAMAANAVEVARVTDENDHVPIHVHVDDDLDLETVIDAASVPLRITQRTRSRPRF